MATVDTRAGTLAYTSYGDRGPTLLLLHAALHDHHDFDAIIPALQRSHRVIAVDWPGCGDAPPAVAPDRLSAPLFADALEDLVDHLGAQSVLLIGNSVGGFAAARLAITRPELVAGLVLVDTGGFIAMTPATRLFCRLMGTPWLAKLILPTFAHSYMKPRSDLDREILTRVIARAKTDAGVAQDAALWRSFATPEHDLRDRAAALTAPTRIIWGRRDTAIPLSAAKSTQAALPTAQLTVLPTGHVPFSSAPVDFLRVVEPFLATAAANPPQPDQDPGHSAVDHTDHTDHQEAP